MPFWTNCAVRMKTLNIRMISSTTTIKTSKMIRAFFSAMVAIACILPAQAQDEEVVSVPFSMAESKIMWTGKKVTGEHTGTLMLKSGFAELSENQPRRVELEMDMNSITCTDLKDAKTNAKLVGHLKSEDFFDVQEYPTGRFVAEHFEEIEGAEGFEPNYRVKGKLTLKGIEKDLEFLAYIAVKGNRLIANGELSFDRSKYNIRYGSKSFFEGLGDRMIYDDVELMFVVSTGM